MRGLYLLLFLALVVNVAALAQTAGDYRSATSGPWDQASTWEVLDPDLVTWNPAATPPTDANTALIQITAFTQVDIVTSVTADDIFIEGDGILMLSTGGSLTVANGAATDDVFVTQGDGFTTNDGFFTVSAGTTVTNLGFINSSPTNFLVDGTVIHNQNGGTVPTASWNTGSTLEIQGVTNGVALVPPVTGQGLGPTGFTGQTFYNLRWNCTGQSASIHLNGELTSISNNFDVVSTGNSGTNSLLLTDASGPYDALNIGGTFTISGPSTVGAGINTGGNPYTISVTGNFVVSSTKATALAMSGNSSVVTLTVGGDMTKSGTSQIAMANTTVSPASAATTTTATLDVNGNVTWNSGNLVMAAGTNSPSPNPLCVGRFNIGGDLNLVAGNWTETSNSTNGRGEIYFDDAKVHSYTSSVAISGTTPFANSINFFVPASNRLNMASNTAFTGIGTFTLSAGATLGVASPQGLVNTTGAGNIRVSGARSYAVGSNIIYNGSGLQNLGQEWSLSGALNNIAANLEINNSGGVIIDFSQVSTSVVGRLTLTSGAFDINSGNTLSIQGDFVRTGGTITGHNDSNLTFAGSGSSTGSLTFTSGSEILNNFAINRSGSIPLGSDLTIHTSGVLSFTNGGVLQLNGRMLTINGDMTSASGGLTSNSSASNLVIDGSNALSSLPLCGSCGTNEFNNVILRRSSGTYTWDGTANINGTFSLSNGTLTHNSGLNMNTNSTFLRGGGTTFSVVGGIGATSTYNVEYTGPLTTGPEMPTVAQNRLNNLTVGGTVVLDKNIRINGDVNINSGTLNATTHNVTMAGANFTVGGGSFQIASTNTFTFARAGTTVVGGGGISGATFGNLTINSGATVSAPNSDIYITGVWTNNGTFTANNGTVVFNGGTQILDTKGQAFWNLISDAGTKTLASDLNVDGTLRINGTLDAQSFTIFIADEWDNQGTYTPGTNGTVVFDGTTQSIDGNSKPFNHVTFANGGTKSLARALDVDGVLTINSGVTLDVSPSNYGLALAGNWVNNGTFNARSGAVTFDGPVIQTVGGSTNTQFFDINHTSTNTVTISSTQSLTNALTLSGGGIFNPNGNFVMVSTATRDARINQITGGSSISATNMTIQRYLPNNANVQNYRYLASPVTNAVVAGWKDDFPISGPWSDHSTQAEWPSGPTIVNPTNASLYIYNESHTPTSTVNDRYEVYPAAASTLAAAPLVNGTGYAAFVRQNAPITIELVGRAATGPVSVTVTDQQEAFNDGWNLIGNPYPAPINWQNVTIPAGVYGQIAMIDNTNTIGNGPGTYVYYTQGGAGIPITYHGTIAQGQAFWVRYLTTGSTQITFQEDDKEAVTNPSVFREIEENILRMHVSGVGRQDELVIAFNDNAQDVADEKYDAFKFTNESGTNLYSMSSDAREMAINTFGALACSREIPIVLKSINTTTGNTLVGSYAVEFSQIESFAPNVDIRLLDNFAGETFVVTPETNVYNFNVTSDPSSIGTNRFKIYIGYKEIDLSTAIQSADACAGGEATITIAQPQPGVAYYATLNGTAVSDKVVAPTSGSLNLYVDDSKLTSDASSIVIRAQSGTCAELPLTNSASLKVQALPALSSVTGSSNCGEGSVILQADGAPSDGSYRWYLTENATDAIEGETGSTFATPVIAKTKTFFVAAVNALGCEGDRMEVTATVNYLDDAEITVDGDLLVSNSDTGNQWYLNDEEIAGATGKTYKPLQNGTYSLVVTSGACTSQVAREYAVTGDIAEEGIKGYVLYPNPTRGAVYVEVQTTDEVGVRIVSTVGTEIAGGQLKQDGKIRRGQFDISGHAAGVYLVVIKHGDKTVTRKIVKN